MFSSRMALHDVDGGDVGGVDGAGVGGSNDRFSLLKACISEVLRHSLRSSTSSSPMALNDAGGGDDLVSGTGELTGGSGD